MFLNRLPALERRESSVLTLVLKGQSNRTSFVIWPFAGVPEPWQEIYRIAHEKAQATLRPEPTRRFECWN